MLNRRTRALCIAVATVAIVWVVAWNGFNFARQSRMTAEKFRAFTQSHDLSRLEGEERARALRELVDKLNALPHEERRKVRRGRDWDAWFNAMTDAEKEAFIEATFPSGVKQMITAFEALPENRRKRTIDEAMKSLRENAAIGDEREGDVQLGESDPGVSPELEKKIRTVGLKTFFAESSAKTKAEVAPLLEEIQRVLETGGRRR